MCPDDTTPDPRTLTHSGDEPEFVQPRGDIHPRAKAPAQPPERPGEPEISQRPGLPEHPEPMAADIEDEEADPVGAPDKPSLGDRLKSDSELQRG